MATLQNYAMMNGGVGLMPTTQAPMMTPAGAVSAAPMPPTVTPPITAIPPLQSVVLQHPPPPAGAPPLPPPLPPTALPPAPPSLIVDPTLVTTVLPPPLVPTDATAASAVVVEPMVTTMTTTAVTPPQPQPAVQVSVVGSSSSNVVTPQPTPAFVSSVPVLDSQTVASIQSQNFAQTGTLTPGKCNTGPGSRLNIMAILGSPLPKLLPVHQDAVNRAKKYAMEQSIKMVLMKQTLAHQQQQAKSFHRHQALVLMCRVYVGSISFELKEDTIRQAFSPFGPIKSINMSWDPVTQKHKGFAFVEYDIPEAAQLALEQMNGVMLGGRNIKVVGRPSNMPQAQSVIDEITEEAKQYNRIYVASIHPELTETDIKNVFEAFGPIKYCKLQQGSSPHRHKGYGFIEYETKQAALEAIASMNLFDLGGQYLRVGRAITPPNALHGPAASTSQMPTAAAVAAAAATAKIQAMDAVATNAVIGLSSKLTSITPAVIPSTIPPLMPAVGGVLPPPGIAIPQALPGGQFRAPTPLIPVAAAPGLVSVAPSLLGAAVAVSSQQEALRRAQEQAQSMFQLKQQEELQKKLLEESEPQTLQQQENMSIKGQSARHLVMQKLMRKVESRVVILRNMVAPEDVDESLQEEIQEECTKYGGVDRVIIYNEKQSEDDDNAEIIVKIFVEFSKMKEAEAARDALNGRFFGGRLVKAELYDQSMFDHNDFSG